MSRLPAPTAARIRRRSSADLPRVARWKSWRPAAQPSVRRARTASSSGGNGRAVVVPEQALHLPRPEPQVVRADLDEVAGDAQSAQVDRRREPRPEDDREPARGVLDEPAERDLRGSALEAVGVVDDEERAFGGAASRARAASWTVTQPPGKPGSAGRSAASRWRTIEASSASHDWRDTTRRGRRNPRRTRRGASSCRSRPARSRRRGGGTRSSRGGAEAARAAAPSPEARGPWPPRRAKAN